MEHFLREKKENQNEDADDANAQKFDAKLVESDL